MIRRNVLRCSILFLKRRISPLENKTLLTCHPWHRYLASRRTTLSVLFSVQFKWEGTPRLIHFLRRWDETSLYSVLLNVSFCRMKYTSSKHYIFESNEWEVSPTASLVQHIVHLSLFFDRSSSFLIGEMTVNWPDLVLLNPDLISFPTWRWWWWQCEERTLKTTRSNNDADITHHAWFSSRRQRTSTIPTDQTHSESRHSGSKTRENFHWPCSVNVLDVSTFDPTFHGLYFSQVGVSRLVTRVRHLFVDGGRYFPPSPSLSLSLLVDHSVWAVCSSTHSSFLFPSGFVENAQEDCVNIFSPFRSCALLIPTLLHTHTHPFNVLVNDVGVPVRHFFLTPHLDCYSSSFLMCRWKNTFDKQGRFPPASIDREMDEG